MSSNHNRCLLQEIILQNDNNSTKLIRNITKVLVKTARKQNQKQTNKQTREQKESKKKKKQ